jgi:inner membrane transporter RhtA
MAIWRFYLSLTMVSEAFAPDHVAMTRRPRPELYLVSSAVFHYLGPSFAVLLFARVAVLGVAWLRIASAALVFAIWRRPWRAVRGLGPEGWRLLLGWAAVLAAMNCCFYEAIDRLPLGTVAAIEFLPVIGLAAFGARTARNALALVLAVAGVYLVSDVRLEARALGLGFAFLNALLFGAYIVLGHRVARQRAFAGIDGLAVAMAGAFVLVTPVGVVAAVHALGDPVALLAGAGVGICSSVVPYVLDQLAMARLARATYSLMLSLLPATATVIGLIVLGQVPTVVELAGVGLVIAGVAIHREARAQRETEARRETGAAAADRRPAHDLYTAETSASAVSAAGAGAAGASGAGAG